MSIISQSIFIQQLVYFVIFHLHTDYTSIVFLFDILRQIKAYIYCFSYLYMNFWRELFKNLALNTKISKVCKFAGFNQNWTLKIFLPECVSCEKFHHQYIKNNLVGKTMYTSVFRCFEDVRLKVCAKFTVVHPSLWRIFVLTRIFLAALWCVYKLSYC